jgi:hypothetical protein
MLIDRILRAARLDAALYEEVEADTGALGQATAVVVLSSVAAGIGAIGVGGIRGLGMGTMLALLGWYVWAVVTWLIGTRVLPEPQTRADLGELLRTIGFASAPGLIRVLCVISPIANIVGLVALIWTLAAMVVAVRQALDYQSTPRAIAVCVIGLVAQTPLWALILWPVRAL